MSRGKEEKDGERQSSIKRQVSKERERGMSSEDRGEKWHRQLVHNKTKIEY